MEGEEEEEKQGTDDGERGRWGFALAFPWFGLFMPRGEERRGEEGDDDPWMAVRPQAQVWL
jgi:hypothetical protein